MSACLELGWEGREKLNEGVGRVRIVRIDSLFLCGAFTIMKFELRFEESRTTKYYWQASAYGYQP